MQSANGIRGTQSLLTPRSQSARAESLQEHALQLGQTQTLEARPGLEIFLQRGVLWLTLEGEPGDILLRAGQKWTASGAGRLVLQAILTDAHWTVRTPAKTPGIAKWLRLLNPVL